MIVHSDIILTQVSHLKFANILFSHPYATLPTQRRVYQNLFWILRFVLAGFIACLITIHNLHDCLSLDLVSKLCIIRQSCKLQSEGANTICMSFHAKYRPIFLLLQKHLKSYPTTYYETHFSCWAFVCGKNILFTHGLYHCRLHPCRTEQQGTPVSDFSVATSKCFQSVPLGFCLINRRAVAVLIRLRPDNRLTWSFPLRVCAPKGYGGYSGLQSLDSDANLAVNSSLGEILASHLVLQSVV